MKKKPAKTKRDVKPIQIHNKYSKPLSRQQVQAVIRYVETGVYAEAGKVLEELYEEKYRDDAKAKTRTETNGIYARRSLKGKRLIDRLREAGDLQKIMDIAGLTDQAIALGIVRLTEAHKTKEIHRSKKYQLIEEPDHEARAKGLMMAAKLKGKWKDDITVHTEYSKEEVEKGIEAIAEKVRARRLMVGNVGNKRDAT